LIAQNEWITDLSLGLVHTKEQVFVLGSVKCGVWLGSAFALFENGRLTVKYIPGVDDGFWCSPLLAVGVGVKVPLEREHASSSVPLISHGGVI